MSTIPSWARPGVKVVCVDAGPCGPWAGPYEGRHDGMDGIREGEVYVILRITKHPLWDAEPCVDLAEVERAAPLALRRFKPLVEDSDDNGIEAQIYRNKHLHHRAPEGADA